MQATRLVFVATLAAAALPAVACGPIWEPLRKYDPARATPRSTPGEVLIVPPWIDDPVKIGITYVALGRLRAASFEDAREVIAERGGDAILLGTLATSRYDDVVRLSGHVVRFTGDDPGGARRVLADHMEQIEDARGIERDERLYPLP
jgi:hypothetical protein